MNKRIIMILLVALVAIVGLTSAASAITVPPWWMIKESLGESTDNWLLSPNVGMMLANKTTYQQIASDTITTVLFDAVDSVSIDGYASATGIYTCATAGYYLVTYNIDITNASQSSNIYAVLSKNNTISYSFTFYNNTEGSTNLALNSSNVVLMSAGDTLSVKCFAVSRGQLMSVYGDGTGKYTTFTVTRIR